MGEVIFSEEENYLNAMHSGSEPFVMQKVKVCTELSVEH